MKIHLHIGTHKTGTTAIQNFAMENRALLARHGVYWPEERLTPYPHQHSMLARMIRSGRTDEAQAFIARSIGAAQAEGNHTLFMSGEGFCTLDDEGAATLAACFAGHEIETVLYFRNVYDYAVSACTQLIKTQNRIPALDQLVHSVRDSLNYDALINRWLGLKGVADLDVRSYDREKTNLLPAFYERLGVPGPAVAAAAPKSARSQNLSLDMATQLLMSATGYSANNQLFHDMRALYADIFSDMPFHAPATAMIGKALCTGEAVKVDHAMLAPFRTELLAEPKPEEADPEATADYFDRLSKFAKRAARLKRKHSRPGLLARLGLKRT